MKRSVLFITIMMVSVLGYSQTTLKGPKAKNATASELAANSSPLRFSSEPNYLKGPKRKNQKVWKKSESYQSKIYIRKDEELPKGPRAKNRKVWKD